MVSQGTYRAKLLTRLTPQITVWHSPRPDIMPMCMDWSRLKVRPLLVAVFCASDVQRLTSSVRSTLELLIGSWPLGPGLGRVHVLTLNGVLASIEMPCV